MVTARYRGVVHQSMALATVVCNEFAIGINIGWLAPMLDSAKFTLTLEETSWIGSLEHVGRIAGVLVGSQLTDTIGRKPILIASSVMYFLNSSLIVLTRSASIICISRFGFGLITGLQNSAVPLYVGEVCSPVIRTTFGSIIMATEFLAAFLEIIVTTHLSYTATAIVNSVILFTMAFTSFWVKETTQFLLMKKKPEKAERTFMWFRGATDWKTVDGEFEVIKENVKKESLKKASPRKTFASPVNRKSCLIVCVIHVLTGAGGYFPIIAYASLIFSSSDAVSSKEFTIFLGAALSAAVIGNSFSSRYFRRRYIFLMSFSMAAFLNFATASLYYAHEHVTRVPYFSWLTFLSISAYCCVHAFMYPYVFLLRVELFPLSVKAIGSGISLVGLSVSAFFTTKLFLYVYHYFAIYYNFFLFAGVNVVAGVVTYFYLPETKGMTLVEIQERLENKAKATVPEWLGSGTPRNQI